MKNLNKKQLRIQLKHVCENPPDFEGFFATLHFQKVIDPKSIVMEKLNNKQDLIQYLFNIVKNNALFEYDGDEKRIFYQNVHLFLKNSLRNEELFPHCWLLDDWFIHRNILNHKQIHIRNKNIVKVIELFQSDGPNINFITISDNVIRCFLIEVNTNPKIVELMRNWFAFHFEEVNKDKSFLIILNIEEIINIFDNFQRNL